LESRFEIGIGLICYSLIYKLQLGSIITSTPKEIVNANRVELIAIYIGTSAVCALLLASALWG